MAISRRDFLRHTGCAAFSAAALVSSLNRFGLVNALAQQPDAIDYKALVCVFLSGGNDGNNTVIPYEDTGSDFNYTMYNQARSGAGLAIAKTNLDPTVITPTSIGRKFALHPGMLEIADLFNQGKAAVLCNIGTLVQPLTRTQYQTNAAARPYQLFSHSDQVAQQQTSFSNTPGQTGWGGRLADNMSGLNAGAPLPMIVSIAGISLFSTGRSTRPLAISAAPTKLNQVLTLEGYDASSAISMTRLAAYNQIHGVDNDHTLIKASNDTVAQALQTSQALSVDPTLQTVFPNTTLGNQLKQIAKLISLRATLGLNRQIFFVSLGGFDTHNTQVNNQASLLTQVSQALKAFYDATVELQVASQVTTFTLSDFGRTLQPSGVGANQVGSDHAWGNHMFVVGDAVRGKDFYGTPGANQTVFPTLQFSGPDDTDSRGRWIPTTSVDQYAATLATWYGLPSSSLSTVFPYIGRFQRSDLGFLM